jgi:hypothetical protein
MKYPRAIEARAEDQRKSGAASFWFVMAGLVPAIHVLKVASKKDVDDRDKRGHDVARGFRQVPSNDAR